ncbi:MAG: radical SAM protein [Fervidicoccaceae archaeon]|nr:radical SAM protein [Fervidicoccaceae archaeon]
MEKRDGDGAPRVQPFYVPPSLVFRQVASLFRFKSLTGWPGLSRWTPDVKTLFNVAAGAVGIGCFGFPIHPVYEVTAACNLRCKHCHARGGKPLPDELDTKKAMLVIRRISEVPEFRMLVFTGGEPLVRPDIYDLMSYARSLGFSVVVATNATLITQSVAKRLRDIGVEGIAASLDFIDPAQHDDYRGVRGAFHAALRGILNAAAEGMYIQINITLSKRNLGQLEELLRLSDKLGAHVVLLYQLIPVGRGAEIMNEALSRDEFMKVLEKLKKIQSEVKPVVVPVGLPEYFAYLHNGSAPPKLSSILFSGCIAGRGMFYVKPNGDVWPCAFIPISAGNLLVKSALEIWRNSPIFRALRDRSNLKGYCATCKYRDICGGCRARALAYTGDLFAPDPMCPLVKEELRAESREKH